MARAAESDYNRKLQQIARQVDMIVRGIAPQDVIDQFLSERIQRALTQYSELITPWAEATATMMVANVSRRNANAWKAMSEEIGKALATELHQAPTGHVFHQKMLEQVQLIKSIPLDAAERVHELTKKALVSGARADTIAHEILRTGEVSASKARTIARTEVSRTASTLTQARAEFAGSEGYIWRTSKDGDVRPTHREQEGQYVRWTKPPKTDAGLAPYHAGCGPNCRCFPDPVF